jgi:hypothetical protein
MLNRRRELIPATVRMLDFVFRESQVLVSPTLFVDQPSPAGFRCPW